MFSRNASEGSKPRNFSNRNLWLRPGVRSCFALKPESLQALIGESVTACRGRRPQRDIQRIASELGIAVSLAYHNKLEKQGVDMEMRQSDRFIVEA